MDISHDWSGYEDGSNWEDFDGGLRREVEDDETTTDEILKSSSGGLLLRGQSSSSNMIGGISEGDTEEEIGGKVRGRSRRELPAHAVQILKAWLVSPEHFHHPYPTAQDQAELMARTGIDKKQLKNWFTNARRRIWKPLVKQKLLQGDTTIDPNILEQNTSNLATSKKHQSSNSGDSTSAGPPIQRNKRAAIASSNRLGISGISGGSSLSSSMQRSQHQVQGSSSQLSLSGPQSDSSFLDLLATAVDEPAPSSMFQFTNEPKPRSRETMQNETAVRVPRETKCEFCLRERVDTQLMPCAHRFHGHCLRPWLEATVTTPSCPVCAVAISNCVRCFFYNN